MRWDLRGCDYPKLADVTNATCLWRVGVKETSEYIVSHGMT